MFAEDLEGARKIAAEFDLPGRVRDCETYGNGHINNTYRLALEVTGRADFHVIVQRINTQVFTNPESLMENLVAVTTHLAAKVRAAGGDPVREALRIYRTPAGAAFVVDDQGGYWRCMHYIPRARSYDLAQSPRQFCQAGLAFGRFQSMLADYPADTLHETIPQFHDTSKRLADFTEVVERDPLGLVQGVRREIDFILERADLAGRFARLQYEGALPLRVTHNDTKLNNVLFDIQTGDALAVIDLDTVMPGLAVNDFGDSIRFGASTGEEDEPDLDKVWCSPKLFEQFTRGFLQGTAGRLTRPELEELPWGAKIMTYECGMRFLGDYLVGDQYFKVSRPHHNLDRARTQIKLVSDMETKWSQLCSIVKTYL